MALSHDSWIYEGTGGPHDDEPETEGQKIRRLEMEAETAKYELEDAKDRAERLARCRSVGPRIFNENG